MEPTLGLLTTPGGSGGGPGCLSGDQLLTSSRMEKDFMGVCNNKGSLVDYANESEVELGLGLSLGNGRSSSKSAWGEHGRILTAKDFPNGFPSRVNTTCSAGTKRAAADTCAEVGSPPSNGASQIVGWPPIRSYRMNSLVNQVKVPNLEQGNEVGNSEKEEKNSKKKLNHGNHNEDAGRFGFVKVNVDGLPIGRKVDVSAYSCYKSLAKTLEEMFFKSTTVFSSLGCSKDHVKKQSILDGSSEFVLTYEDKDGDWMLVGDVPWEMFVNTVRRLRIMKTSEANGLAPRFQENGDKQKGKRIG